VSVQRQNGIICFGELTKDHKQVNGALAMQYINTDAICYNNNNNQHNDRKQQETAFLFQRLSVALQKGNTSPSNTPWTVIE